MPKKPRLLSPEALAEKGLDPIGIVEWLLEYRARMETGIYQEKLVKGVPMHLLEAYPRLELEATKVLIGYIESQGGAKTDGSVTINISTLGDSLTDKAP